MAWVREDVRMGLGRGSGINRDMTDSAYTSRGTLPSALLAVIPRRLRLLSLLWSLFWLLAVVGAQVLTHSLDGEFWPISVNILFGTMVLSSLLVALACSRWRSRPIRLLWIGLLFEVVCAGLIGAAENLAPYAADESFRPGVSWVALWVVIYPLVVPSRMVHTVVTSVLAWSTLPITLAIFEAHGMTHPGPGIYLGMHLFTGLLVVSLAIVSHRIVFRMGKEVQRYRTLGSYRLEERVGEGGMGEVWLARHRLLARPAAIKLIRPEALGAQGSPVDGAHRLVSRFQREAQATAALRSPHTVELFDFGVAEDGAFYYVMEHLDGMDLERFTRRFGAMEPARVVAVLLQACHSLAEAHTDELVHRDIKPANVMVCRYGRDVDYVKVLDFGMVKRVGDPELESTTLTQEGAVAGTPAFMPPEMALGDQEVGPAADLYSLGCVAYWLLTEQLVFTAQTPTAMLVKHATEAPVPPSRRSELDVPEALDEVVMRCLAKKPADRYESADALRQALLDTGLAESWTPERARRWWDTHIPPGEKRILEPVDSSDAARITLVRPPKTP
jgi:eukaryotic-like serine/threonine-protein kinase